MFRQCRNLSLAAIFWIALPSPRTFACGPFFPSTILSQGDDAILNTPTADFVHEMDLIAADLHPPFKSNPPGEDKTPFDQSLAADAASLQRALSRSAMNQSDRDKIVAAYLQMRGQINSGNVHAEVSPGAIVPAGLPPQFADYLSGIDCYQNDRMNDARTYFKKILARPAEQRRDRAVWAAFMIGKSYLHAHPQEAIVWFRRTREYARHFRDSLGLAASSYGWEARAQLGLGHIEQAIDLYLLQHASGDPTAAMSLRTVAERAMRGSPESLARFAADSHARQVITALILANGGPFDHQPDHKLVSAWLNAIESVQIEDVAGADRLAWLMYQGGRFDDARRWAGRADQNTPMTLWVNAKLLLRDGKFEPAMKLLARAAKKFPTNEEWAVNWPNDPNENGDDDDRLLPAEQIDGEMGAIALSRGQYVESLDLLLKGRWLDDAAYVAERVLSADELTAYVDKSWPPATLKRHEAPTTQGSGDSYVDAYATDDAQVASMVRELLARRLVRLGRCQDARPYFLPENQAILDDYISSIRDGYDAHRTADDRAGSLFDAARTARDHGMELMGTELGPDWASYGGDFERDDPAERTQAMLSISADEARRISQTAETINRRYHYRYVAADFAWSAAQLLPDNSDELAEICCEAGGWLKARDPVAANRFYQALVQRCSATRLGKEAVKLKWFPSTQPSQ